MVCMDKWIWMDIDGWVHGWIDEYECMGELIVRLINRWDKWLDK